MSLMKRIEFTRSGQRELDKLPSDIQKRIEAKLMRYATTGAGNVKALVGESGARLRVGDYRVAFVETADLIVVRAIAHRREIYRKRK
jgi:mRNA interferase RelE/StbE